ncbi:MAG TPA: ATP-binding cassette domain-containing protein [Bacillota bacterium]|nr:ATP-binding cassette domain-containing protein [Bacillota bacterium]HPT86326.1 ATP-binding cassette domain-containing protein [Bacillota bacterium]
MLALEHIDLTLQDGSDEVRILNGISLKFEPGKLYVITGPNGGGKTSIAKVISGIYQPARGRIMLDGKEITGWSITERAKQGIRYAFQNPPRFKGIDIGWYLRLAYPEITENHIRSVMAKIGLCPENYLNRVVDSTLSGGEMKRLEIASVLLGPTRVAVLDEPEAGVDLWSFEQLRDFIVHSHQRSEGRITIIISHHERFLEVADEIVVVAGGVVQERGTMEKIRPLIEEGINCRWRNICLGEEA